MEKEEGQGRKSPQTPSPGFSLLPYLNQLGIYECWSGVLSKLLELRIFQIKSKFDSFIASKSNSISRV